MIKLFRIGLKYYSTRESLRAGQLRIEPKDSISAGAFGRKDSRC